MLSHRRDTSLEVSFRQRKKYLADVLSLDPCNTVCIHSKIQFQIIFRGEKIHSFWNVQCIKSMYDSMIRKYHTTVILSRLHDTTETQ